MNNTTLKSRRARLLCGTGLAVAGAMLVSAAYAQESETMETVVITGSRIAVNSSFEAPTPVSIVSSQDIQLSGTVNVENLLAQSPQFIGSTNGGQTGNTIQANGDSGAAWLNLRGLGEVRNLVLVNGRRFAIQGTRLTTDVNTIPASLIERTEIVTGGNSAVYGSDAISGVVNFIMKQNFEGIQGDAQYTFDQFTTSPIYNFDVTLGGNFGHDKGNLVVAMNYMDRKGFTQADHGGWTSAQYTDACVTTASYSPTNPGTKLNGNTGAACVASGGVNGFVEGGSASTPQGFIKAAGGSPLVSYASAPAALQTLYDAAGLKNMTNDGILFTNDAATYPAPYRNRDTTKDLYNLISDNYMQIPQQRWMINAFGHYDFNKYVQAYTEFHYSNNQVSQQLTPGANGGVVLINTHNPAFTPALQSVMDYYDQHETGTTSVTGGTTTLTTVANDGLVALSAGKRYVEGGYRLQEATREAFRFAGGLRGDLGSVSDSFLKDLAYDAYYTYSRTHEADAQSGSMWGDRWVQDVKSAVNGAMPLCDPFGLHSLSQACLADVMVKTTADVVAEMQDVNLSFTGTAFDLPAGAVQFAAGTEWRYTMAKFTPDALTAAGAAGFNKNSPTAGSMVSHEAYGEVRVPVLKDLPFIQSFSLNGAFRYSDYNLSSAHNIWTWSVGGDWHIISDLGIRAQYQRATRAPNVGELYGGQASNTSPTLVDPCGSKQPTQQRTDVVKALCVAQGVAASDVWTTIIQNTPDLLRYVSGGNPDLRPETADTITMGVVFQPEAVPSLQTSLDFYSIQVKDMINALAGGAGGVLANCFSQADPNNLYCNQLFRDHGSLFGRDGYINAGNANISGLKTQGFDFAGQYGFGIDWGVLSNSSRINIGSNWNYVLELISLPDVTQPNVKSDCAGAYGNTYCFYEPTPRIKGTTRITWTDGPVSLSLKWRYIDGVMLDKYLIPLRRGTAGMDPANFTRPSLPNMNYFDVAATWDVNDSIEIYGGINNLFSKDPPILGSSASYANSFPATYDSFGRVTFIGIRAKTD
jgi:iron complex outermembrane recepter protein